MKKSQQNIFMFFSKSRSDTNEEEDKSKNSDVTEVQNRNSDVTEVQNRNSDVTEGQNRNSDDFNIEKSGHIIFNKNVNQCEQTEFNVESIGENPHQPNDLPRGIMEVEMSFQCLWYKEFPWLHYLEDMWIKFCAICVLLLNA